jgi:pimeloyl-ACP methyl ester carboxylesterase
MEHSMSVKPFRIDIPQARLDWISSRLGDAQWPVVPEGAPWEYGTSVAELRGLVDYWLRHYDWRAQEAALNNLPQFIARVEDYDIQFIHVRGSGDNPRPVMLTHGWPGSIIEFIKVIEPLTQPEKFGGAVEDALTVVIPSLPGYGFSSKPAHPIGPRLIARLFDRLMTEQLGYTNYIAQGGDWGSSVSSWLGIDGVGCSAVHLNFVLGWRSPAARADNDEEKAALQYFKDLWRTEGGYMLMQASKPLTLSYAMYDSPLGVAAWILEKFKTWSDLEHDNLWSVYSKDELITNIMIYLVTDTFGTAAWLYNGIYKERVPPLARVDKPVGIAKFPGEIAFLPRSYVEKSYNVVRWTEMPRGGHFAALEQPQLFVEELLAFAHELRR